MKVDPYPIFRWDPLAKRLVPRQVLYENPITHELSLPPMFSQCPTTGMLTPLTMVHFDGCKFTTVDRASTVGAYMANPLM